MPQCTSQRRRLCTSAIHKGYFKMKRGYSRVSTADQSVDLQVNALKEAGCELIYIDEGVSGSTTSRPELSRLLTDLEDGDHLVVWKLDRLGAYKCERRRRARGAAARGQGGSA